MKQGKTGTARALAFALASTALLFGAACGAQENAKKKHASFSKWGLSFEYPPEWTEHPAHRTAMMKDHFNKEYGSLGMHFQELAMITEPNDKPAALVIVWKSTVQEATELSQIIEERKEFYEKAKQAGTLKKVNSIKETTVGKLPAVRADLERGNGRGLAYWVIDGKTVYGVSFVVVDAANFPKYAETIEHLVSTITVAGKNG